ncbi:response regulator transcription factor [Actinoallomurus oryzae]
MLEQLDVQPGHRVLEIGRGRAITLRPAPLSAAPPARLAAARSNADIAAELFISIGTVKTHVANIQAKLGVANRVGIAAWAWETDHTHP